MHKIEKAKHSINTDQLSQDALVIFELLDAQQLKIIQKHYPFRATRNRAIARLKRKGVKIQTLVELTGLQRAAILRITKGIKPESAGSNPETAYEMAVSDTLNKIVKIGKELNLTMGDIKTAIFKKNEEK